MGAQQELETEIKLDPPEDLAVPDLTALPGVSAVEVEEVPLEAVYFDTDDLHLARARVTLRRRTGGGDEGWHVKEPGDGAHDRTETRLPLGRATKTVPAELRRRVRLPARGRDLRPVVTLRTVRHLHHLLGDDGRVLAEVCDDHVAASRPSGGGRSAGEAGPGSEVLAWREWEVELREGDAQLLQAAVDLLTEAGAAPAASASKLARALGDRLATGAPDRGGMGRKQAGGVLWAYLDTQVRELVTWAAGIRDDEPDAVHKTRVATRRLRGALKTFRPLVDREVTDPISEELREVGTVLGRARDAEVIRDRLTAALTGHDPELVIGPVHRRMAGDLGGEHGRRLAEAADLVDSDRFLRLLDSLDRLLAEPPWLPPAHERAAAVLPARVRKVYRTVARRVRSAEATPPVPDREARLHAARKAARRARYAAEVVAAGSGGRAQSFAEAMEQVQDALGELQDSAVARSALLDAGTRAHLEGENAFTWGRLHALEEARGREAARTFEDVWAAASRKRLRRWMKK